MFHQTTTIRHNLNPQKNLFRESRLTHNALATLKAGADKAVGSVASAGGFLYKLSWPIRKTLFPVTFVTKKAWEGGKWVVLKGETPARTIKEGGVALGKDTIAIPALTLIGAPIEDIKINIIDQFRTVVNELFIGAVKRPLERVGKTIENTRNGFSQLFSFRPKPIEAAKSFTFAFGNALAAPFGPFAAAGVTGYEMSKNILRSKWQYATRIRQSVNEVFQGLNRTAHSYETAKAETAVRRAKVEAEEAEKKLAAANDDKEIKIPKAANDDKETLRRRNEDQQAA